MSKGLGKVFFSSVRLSVGSWHTSAYLVYTLLLFNKLYGNGITAEDTGYPLPTTNYQLPH